MVCELRHRTLAVGRYSPVAGSRRSVGTPARSGSLTRAGLVAVELVVDAPPFPVEQLDQDDGADRAKSPERSQACHSPTVRSATIVRAPRASQPCRRPGSGSSRVQTLRPPPAPGGRTTKAALRNQRRSHLVAVALAQGRAQIADGIDQAEFAAALTGPVFAGEQGGFAAVELAAAARLHQRDEAFVDFALDAPSAVRRPPASPAGTDRASPCSRPRCRAAARRRSSRSACRSRTSRRPRRSSRRSTRHRQRSRRRRRRSCSRPTPPTSSTKAITGIFFSSASARMRRWIRWDCAAAPPGELIESATARTLRIAKARSSERATLASVRPGLQRTRNADRRPKAAPPERSECRCESAPAQARASAGNLFECGGFSHRSGT